MNNYLENIKMLIPGYLQGITRVCISYPFDYIRIKMQTNQETHITSAIKNNYKQSFRGLFIPLTIVPIDRSISFAIYEKIKSDYNSPLLGSIVPSIVSNLYMTPINSINSNYIYFNKTTLKNIITTNYNKQIYNGIGIEIVRNSLSSFLFLYSYNIYSTNFNNSFINGTLASLTMWTITYPLDTIKTNRFIFKNKSYLNIIKDLNINSLYKGIGLVYLRALPSAGGGMYMYEYIKQLLSDK